MGKYNRKVDGNQRDIIATFESCGFTVVNLSRVGEGCPDLLIGRAGKCWLVEAKNPEGRNRIEQSQIDFAEAWNGPDIAIVRTVEDVVRWSNGQEN
jgi:Holliday junction resolvase